MFGPGRFVVAPELLKRFPAETVLILRLGALANAITALGTLTAGSMATGVGSQRDTLQLALVNLSYLKEAIDLIDNKRAWELIDKGVNAGYRLPKPPSEYRKLFSRGDGSHYRRILIAVRSTKGFHVDPEPFQQWLDQIESPDVTLVRKDTGSPMDWIFSVSAWVLSHIGPTMDQLFVDAMEDSLVLPFLIEAMICGLVVEGGGVLAHAWRPLKYYRVRIDYRPVGNLKVDSERSVVQGDPGGDIRRAISDLRDRVTLVLGGRRAGAYWQGPDVPLELSSSNGRAIVTIESEVDAPSATASDDRSLLSGFGDAAEWGAFATKRALEYAHAVRGGTVSEEQTDRFIRDVTRDIGYWEKRCRQAESARQRFRGAR